MIPIEGVEKARFFLEGHHEVRAKHPPLLLMPGVNSVADASPLQKKGITI